MKRGDQTTGVRGAVGSDRSLSRDESGNIEVLGDIVMVGVVVVIGIVVIVLLLGLVDTLTESEPPTKLEFSYEGNTTPAYADSFGTTNEDGEYDGLLTVSHAHGSALPAAQLEIRGTSSLDGPTPWTDSDPAADGPAYGPDDTVDAGNRLQVWVTLEDPVTVVWHDPETDQSATLGSW